MRWPWVWNECVNILNQDFCISPIVPSGFVVFERIARLDTNGDMRVARGAE
jgi:hypothetical protein